ncbi:MAG: YgjV family protein [Clostridia bacterium]|nr:YgjV family protein [Clostridia bacterium]
MIVWTKEYILSQIFAVALYLFLCTSYFLKSRKKILIFNIIAHVFQAASLLLLGGMTGMAMAIFLIFRDSFLALDEKNRNLEKTNKRDNVIFVIFIAIIVALTFFTYNGPSSLLSVFATLVSTFAIWQKSTRIYKLLGMPISFTWLIYNITLRSIFATILEFILLISTIVGYLKDKVASKSNGENV